MLGRSVRYAPAAERDLEVISDWLADATSEPAAIRYIRRIKQRIETLADGSERGTVRDGETGIRVIGILPSVSVAFFVEGDSVNIQRVIYGGQDWQTALTAEDDD